MKACSAKVHTSNPSKQHLFFFFCLLATKVKKLQFDFQQRSGMKYYFEDNLDHLLDQGCHYATTFYYILFLLLTHYHANNDISMI